ncbi:flagellar hook-length control protein FliK [Roseobacter ponti]|uniref:Flagellar hook-length control protein FliK n=1 Tax=Roseobacter ponti TaxID=1891787 RepID=A0A858SZC1_9RHOB|nr:flagellar hook-length control protein FliK [Roseobacter ponti]QJF52993.1 flagellar hook-length control protein FliK [Roseobacter ponti]
MPTPAAARADMRNTASAIAMQPVNPATVHANQVAARDNPDLVMPSVQDADTMLQWDPRAAGSSTAQQAILRAETPGMIGRQMAEALQRLPDRPVELALSPRELGKVRMTISAAEGSITVNVLAERPETLDLMRRNIDELAREFQALGFETISFAFSEGQQQTNEDHSDDAPRVTETDTAHHSDPAETADAPVRLVESTGLDLRL